MNFRLSVVIGCVLLLTGTTGFTAGEVLVIRAGYVIDPASGDVTENQWILIEGENIVAVGDDVDVPDAAETIDLSGSWVMPGLMDAHTHLTFNGRHNVGNAYAYLTESSALRALRGATNARLVLEAGFTTVRDVGNSAEWAMADVRRAIRKGWISGPTIFDAGKIIAPYGGQLGGMTPETGPLWQFEYIDADSPQAIRAAVRKNIYYGANVIKLVSDSNRYFYSQEEIRAAVEEAGRAGLKVAVHAYGGEAARNAILGGAHAIEHGFSLDEELLKLMKKHGTYLVGTDFPAAHLEPIGFPGSDRYGAMIIARLKLAYEVGVKLAFGTDVVIDLKGVDRAQMALDYLAVWEEAGVPAPEILRSMTTEVAELLGISGKRGSIAEGQKADIVATPENPLVDIQALRDIQFVMKNGDVVRSPVAALTAPAAEATESD